MKVKNITVIEITNNYIKIASAKTEINSIFFKEIGGLNDNNIASIIKEYFDRLKLKNQNIFILLPSNLTITKNIEIPSTDHKEIREIVNLQAYRHTPYSKEEVIADYIDLGTYKNSYTKILLIIVPKQVIKRYFDILEKASFNLDGVFFIPEVIAIGASTLFKINSNNYPVSLVNIDEFFTDFLVIFKEKVIFNRSIPIGMQNFLLEKDKNILRFTEEVKKSIEAYQFEGIEKIPQMLFLTGISEVLPVVYDSLAKILHIPIKTILNFENILMSKDVSETISSTKKISFLNIISSLVAFENIRVNIVPEDVKLRKIFEEKGRALIKSGIYLTTCFVLFLFILITKIYFKTLYLKNIKNQYERFSSESEKLQKDYEKVIFIKNYLLNRGNSLDILIELYNILPEDVELSNIRLDEQKRLSLKGSADSMSSVFSFAEQLSKSKYFKDTKTRYTSKRKESTREITDFEITCSVRTRE